MRIGWRHRRYSQRAQRPGGHRRAQTDRPGTDDGDYNIKMRNLRRFIAEDGDKGKVTLRFRGREITHQDIGMRMLERIRDELADVAVVEHMPKLEGRQMIMVLAPR